MRIAIAGSGGLAQILAHHINSQTAHQFIILSRQAQPHLNSPDYQVVVVNYDDQQNLLYSLRGIDLVISTVSGNPQINLIDAAAQSRVRRFVPAEFEGPPERRPQDDPLDRGRSASLQRLRHWATHRSTPMRSTVFCCGVFYERFARGGLASRMIGTSTGIQQQGAYLMDIERSTATVVEYHTNGRPIYLSMTAVDDVGRFVAAALALDLDNWPAQFRMRGDRRTVAEIISWAEAIKGGVEFSTEVIAPEYLGDHLNYAMYYEDTNPERVKTIQELIATEQGRYDFEVADLNLLVNVQPVAFWDWLVANWS
ncbi:isoflavone reductase family protein-like protein [Xylogone sp. PMI_703]|nr:isoflavone reductase family protein-like protein [Xylogone sp. PMI_703]